MLLTRLTELIKIFLILMFFSLVSGCATTQTVESPDPLEPVNRVSYNFTDTLDVYLLRPVAETYVEYTPELVRTGVTNFFDNLAYLNVVLNSLLQGKIDQGLSDATRFIFNSTIGLAGLVDVGTPIGLPKHDEDLGQTLAVWGAGEGSYIYVPVQGPNSARDLPDLVSSTLLNPLFYVTGTVLFPLTALNAINKRANLLEATEIRDEAAVDPYTFTREAYLQRRQYLIYDGNPPVEGYEEIFEGEGNTGNEDTGVLQIK